MNTNTYFEINENFNKIISENLKDKKINSITQIPTGWTNIVYEVETDEKNFFFRFPRDEFWSRTIVKDYEFAKYIHNKTEFNTVNLNLLYNNERPFSMHSKIPGTPLAEKMNNLSESEIETVSDEISKFMFQLHSLQYNKCEIFTINDIDLNLNGFLDELLNAHVSKKDIIFWKKENTGKKECCLVHGDLNSSNILLDENNHVTAVIDFGFGGFGNKYDDIARIIGRTTPAFKDKIITNYEKYSSKKLDLDVLENNISTWTNIDNGYINYMKTIGIYND